MQMAAGSRWRRHWSRQTNGRQTNGVSMLHAEFASTDNLEQQSRNRSTRYHLRVRTIQPQWLKRPADHGLHGFHGWPRFTYAVVGGLPQLARTRAQKYSDVRRLGLGNDCASPFVCLDQGLGSLDVPVFVFPQFRSTSVKSEPLWCDSFVSCEDFHAAKAVSWLILACR